MSWPKSSKKRGGFFMLQHVKKTLLSKTSFDVFSNDLHLKKTFFPFVLQSSSVWLSLYRVAVFVLSTNLTKPHDVLIKAFF